MPERGLPDQMAGPAAPGGVASERPHQRAARALYTLAWYLAAPLAIGYLLWRARRQPDYRRRIGERFGRHPRREDAAPLIWIHAVSVGETRAAQPLVRALLDRYPGHRLLLTHMTPTGLDAGRELFGALMGGEEPPRIAQALLPYDYPFALRRFFRAWRPAIGIVMETELWPNLVAVAREQRVPLALVNARLSERSLRKGRRWAWLMKPALAGLSEVLAQTEADAQRVRELGRADVRVLGNLKFDVAPAPRLELLGHVWRLGLLAGGAGGGHRPAVLAASTRDGEEVLILDAWCAWRELARASEAGLADASNGAAAADGPDGAGGAEVPDTAGASGEGPPLVSPPPGMPWPPLLVIVPRHPQRFDEVAGEVQARGLRLIRRSHWGDRKPPATERDAEVLLGDSMGEMFAYYALADAAIIGGSLLPFGGQNLIEACAVGVPVVVGPHTFNFEAATDQAILEDAALRSPDAASALAEALAIVADPLRRQTIGEHALAFSLRHRGATARTMAALAPLLEEKPRQPAR
jgi:3-deoxy-D-manno-octulosonic-acid transferase